jgi:ABC-type uncharacterized transport system fused permease/ATPase subunit
MPLLSTLDELRCPIEVSNHLLIIHLNRCQKLEGDFRFMHVRLRTFATSIALMRGEHFEQVYLCKSLGSMKQLEKLSFGETQISGNRERL